MTETNTLLTVSPRMFRIFYEAARKHDTRVREATSEFSDSPDALYRSNGVSGYCVRADGELVFVHSVVRGQGDFLIRDAIAHGAKFLDCFDGYLPKLYARHGFREVDRMPNWTPGGPDVVVMRRDS